VHDSAPTFVPAATFGQLTEATHGPIANTRAGNPRAVLLVSENCASLFSTLLHRASATAIAMSASITTTSSQKHFCGVKSDRSNTPTTLNISEQVSCLSQKPTFIGQATSFINMSRMARHFLRVLTVIRGKKNKIQTEFR
jgi:hypothetical protein